MGTTFNLRPSSVIKKDVTDTQELEVDSVTVLVDDDSTIGDVLYNNSGTWTRVNAANVDNAAGILVDESLRFNETTPANGNQTLRVARRLIVAPRDALNYAADVNTDALRTAAETALLTQHIKVVEGY